MSHEPQAASPHDSGNSALFIEGYFTSRINAGERPKYGYPANHLPITKGDRMEFVTSFVAASAAA